MIIEIWSDFSCPFCYIGKTRFEKALDAFAHKDKIKVVYKAFLLNPNAPVVNPDDSYTYFSKIKNIPLNQVKTMFLQTSQSAKAEGLVFDYDHMQMTSTVKAHRLAKFARTKDKEKEIAEKLFAAYFTLGKNIADDKVLIDIADAIGLEKTEVSAFLQSNTLEEMVEDELKEAESFGIHSVPFYVFNRKYAVSGAQSEAMFHQALVQSFSETSAFEKIGTDENDCGPEGCNI